MKYSVIALAFCLSLFFMTSIITAEAPRMISYQGQLTGPGGAIIADSSFDFTFSIYCESTGGSPLWTETHLDVEVKDGFFDVYLGSNVPIPDIALEPDGGGCPETYLEITVSGEIIVPRSRLVSSPYTFIARRVRGDISTSMSQIVIDYPGDSLTPPEERLIDARCDKKKTALTALSIDIAGDTTGMLEQATDTGGAYIMLNSVGEQILEARCDKKKTAISASSYYEGDVWDYVMKTDTGSAIVWLGNTDGMMGDTSAAITQSIDEIAASIKCDYAVLPGYGNSFTIQTDTGGSSMLMVDTSGNTIELKTSPNGAGIIVNDYGCGGWPAQFLQDANGSRMIFPNASCSDTGMMLSESAIVFYAPDAGYTTLTANHEMLQFQGPDVLSVFGPGGYIHVDNGDTIMKLDGEMLAFTGFDVRGVFGPGGYTYENDAGDTNVLITPDGIIEVANTVKASSFGIDGDTGTSRVLRYKSNDVRRFEALVNSDPEDGSNGGSNYAIRRYNDAGAPLGVAMFIERSTGNIGIGNTTPEVRLRVTGDICATGTIEQCSDARFKSNIQPLDNALAKISQLCGIRFDWRCDDFPEHEFSEDKQVGFIAQELVKILPEAVSQNKEGYYSVDYGKVTPLLVEAVKELKTENDELRARLAKIESLLLQLEEKN
jgi:hypothetical protein